MSKKPSSTADGLEIYRSSGAGMPNLIEYVKDFFRRREFAVELSRSNIRATNANNVLGSFWLVLNPLLLACVYYLLVAVLSSGKSTGSERFTHIVAGIFAYYFFAGCMTTGAASVTSAGRLIMNTPFPRLLLIFAIVRTAFRKFLPTIPIFFIIYLVGGLKLHVAQLLAIPVFFLLALAGFGIAALLATAQVYFRDTSSFLPYINRIWLYVSPILYYSDRIYNAIGSWAYVNPLYALMGLWGDVLIKGTTGSTEMWIAAGAWSIGIFLVGSLVFISRESDFAVRI